METETIEKKENPLVKYNREKREREAREALANQPQVQPEATVAIKEVKKKTSMELEIDPSASYVFELVKKSEASRNVVVGSSNKIFDVELNRIREIKYIPVADTIFVDEMDASLLALDPPFIGFHNNELAVEGTDVNKLHYLIRHDDNEDNPRRLNQREPLFKLRDKTLLEKKKNEDYDTIDKVRQKLAERDADELRPLARIIFNIIETDDLALRNRLRDFFNDSDVSVAAKNAKLVLDNLSNPKFDKQYAIMKGFEKGILTLKADQNSVVWTDTGVPVCEVRNTKNQDKTAGELAEWTFTSAEGKKFWEVYSKKV
jgi:hypothetical protein